MELALTQGSPPEPQVLLALSKGDVWRHDRKSKKSATTLQGQCDLLLSIVFESYAHTFELYTVVYI